MREMASCRACLTALSRTKQFSTCSWTRPEWCQGHKDLEEGNSMTSDKPRRKLSVQLLLFDMQAQTGCQRQRIADEIDQTALQLGCSNPIDSVEQCFSGNETRTRTSCIWFWPWCRASGVDFSWECWCDQTAAASISAELLNAWRHPVYRWAQLTIHTADRCSNPIWTVWEPERVYGTSPLTANLWLNGVGEVDSTTSGQAGRYDWRTPDLRRSWRRDSGLVLMSLLCSRLLSLMSVSKHWPVFLLIRAKSLPFWMDWGAVHSKPSSTESSPCRNRNARSGRNCHKANSADITVNHQRIHVWRSHADVRYWTHPMCTRRNTTDRVRSSGAHRSSTLQNWRVDHCTALVVFSPPDKNPSRPATVQLIQMTSLIVWGRYDGRHSTTPQDKQLYIYNVKFERIANHGSLKFFFK